MKRRFIFIRLQDYKTTGLQDNKFFDETLKERDYCF